MTTQFIKGFAEFAAAMAVLVSSAVRADQRRWTRPEHFAIPLHDWSQNGGQLMARPLGSDAGWTGETARLYKAAETIGNDGEYTTRCTFQPFSSDQPHSEFAPGKPLVNRTLADEIGVSVMPVREAINRLTSEGLVEHVPGAGAFVRKVDREQLNHLHVLRDALEGCAAGEATRNITVKP